MGYENCTAILHDVNYLNEMSSGSMKDGLHDQSGAMNIGWFLTCAFLVFFMKSGFLLLEFGSFIPEDVFIDHCYLEKAKARLVTLKIVDFCFSIVAFYVIGYGILGTNKVYTFIQDQINDSTSTSTYSHEASW